MPQLACLYAFPLRCWRWANQISFVCLLQIQALFCDVLFKISKIHNFCSCQQILLASGLIRSTEQAFSRVTVHLLGNECSRVTPCFCIEFCRPLLYPLLYYCYGRWTPLLRDHRTVCTGNQAIAVDATVSSISYHCYE